MRYAVKIPGQIRINDFLPSTQKCLLNSGHGLMRILIRAIRIASRMKVRFKDRHEKKHHGGLYYTIFYCRYSQRPPFAISLGYPDPPHWAGPVGFAFQLTDEVVPPGVP